MKQAYERLEWRLILCATDVLTESGEEDAKESGKDLGWDWN